MLFFYTDDLVNVQHLIALKTYFFLQHLTLQNNYYKVSKYFLHVVIIDKNDKIEITVLHLVFSQCNILIFIKILIYNDFLFV